MTKKPTKAEREHMSKVAALGCMICGKPAQCHHITGAGVGLRASNYEVIPLCHDHHSAQTKLKFGHAVHKGTKSFEANYGTQQDMLKKVMDILNG